MTSYTKSTNFATKDTLTSGDPLKIVKGTEINTEFDNIQSAVNSKSDTASPTFTGTVTIPTASVSSTTDSSSVSTGSIVTAGGIGIAKSAYVGTTLNVAGNTILGDASTDTLNVGNGGLVKDASGNVGIGTASPGTILDIFKNTGNDNTLNTIRISTVTSPSDQFSFRLAASKNLVGAPYAQVMGPKDGNGWLAFTTGTSDTERMRIDSSGNVGIGTSSPAVKTEVSSSVAGGVSGVRVTNTDATSTSIASFQMKTGASANVWQMFSRNNQLTFGVASVADYMTLTSAGNLLVNATAVVSNSDEAIGAVSLSSTGPAATFKNSAGATAGTVYMWNAATTGNNLFAYFATEASFTARGTISYNRAGGLVAYNTSSDYRLKTVKGNVQDALGKVALLKPCYGRMTGAEQDIDFFVAHELQEVVPSAVTGDKDELNEDGSPKYQMVDKSALIPLLTAAIQEQQAIITSLTDRITALENT